MAPGGGGLHVKPGATPNMGQGSQLSLLFFSFFFVFVFHVTIPTCLFVVQLIHALASTVCSSSLIGQRLSYFIDHGQPMNKDDWQHQKCGPRVKRSPPPGLIRCYHRGAPCSMILCSSPFTLCAFCQSSPCSFGVCVCTQSACQIPPPQDHFGTLVNSGSSPWWCRHSSPLSQRATLTPLRSIKGLLVLNETKALFLKYFVNK